MPKNIKSPFLGRTTDLIMITPDYTSSRATKQEIKMAETRSEKTASRPDRILWHYGDGSLGETKSPIPKPEQSTAGAFSFVIDAVAAILMFGIMWAGTFILFGIMP